MPVLKAYPSGLTLSRPHAGTPPTDTKRGRVVGWSTQAAARHVAWLMSIDHDPLMRDAELWAYTLTVRDTPGSAKEFHALRRAWFMRLERALPLASVTPLWCWVMEWQQRGTPHLHGVIVAPPGSGATVHALVNIAWPDLARSWGASSLGQDVRRVDGAPGWFAYLAKHIGRGKGHAQRTGLPPGWQSSGRLWGHSEGWPTSEVVWEVDGAAFVQLRRLVHSWALADARSERDPNVRRRRMVYLRRRRRQPAESSQFVGMREWCPPEVFSRLMLWCASQGSELVSRTTGEVLES